MDQSKLDRAIEFHRKHDFQSAKKLYQELLLTRENNFFPLFLLGTLELDLNNIDEAKKYLEMSLEKNPNHIDTYLNLSAIYFDKSEFDKSKEYLEAGKKYIDHTNYNNHKKLCFRLANTYKITGELDKAKLVYEEMYSFDPFNLVVVYFLYELNAINLDSTLKKKIKLILKEKKSSHEDQIFGNLLLSKYANKSEKYKDEYNFLINAHNKIFEIKENYFKKRNDLFLSTLTNVKQFYDHSVKISVDKKLREAIKPIFIISLPRSGSTLLEKLIVFNQKNLRPGEETDAHAFIGDTIVQDPKKLENFDLVVEKIISLYRYKNLISDTNEISFTDKSVSSHYYLGWIKKIFPRAIFINCARDPKAIITSILRNPLSEASWAHRLDDILRFIDTHHKLINFWKSNYQIEIYDINYENLIKDFEEESKKLLNYCGLKYSTDIDQFNTSSNYVSKTASSIQVRKPVYKKVDTSYKLLASQFENVLKKYSWSNY